MKYNHKGLSPIGCKPEPSMRNNIVGAVLLAILLVCGLELNRWT